MCVRACVRACVRGWPVYIRMLNCVLKVYRSFLKVCNLAVVERRPAPISVCVRACVRACVCESMSVFLLWVWWIV